MKHTPPHLALSPARVVQAADAVDVVLSPGQAALLIHHATLVLEANRFMNLTRITDSEDVLGLHIVDSLAFLPHVGRMNDPIVDIGSGAGYPGIPLAVLGYEVTLCESVKKKAAFLEQTVRAVGLRASVQPVRAEEYALAHPAGADTVVARAVSATASLLELAAPLLRTSGRLIALKGTLSAEELDRANAAAPLCGMTHEATERYVLPTGEHRTVVVYRKVSEPRLGLPRRAGAAQRTPLG